jgi:hypothetical protein
LRLDKAICSCCCSGDAVRIAAYISKKEEEEEEEEEEEQRSKRRRILSDMGPGKAGGRLSIPLDRDQRISS